MLQLRQAGRLPHAILLYGMPGTGIRPFAQVLARALMCSAGGEFACGDCHACSLNAAGTHPDLVQLEPEKEGGQIKVDQVRELVAFGHASAQMGGYRVVILGPAEAMNANAANSLLKTLEEPGEQTLLMLLSYAPATVLPTIRSRCQSLAMTAPTAEQGRSWLEQQLSNPGALSTLHQFAPRQPLYGLRLEPMVDDMQRLAQTLPALIEGEADVLQVVKTWAPIDLAMLLTWLYQWLSAACLIGSRGGEEDAAAVSIHRAWVARAPLSRLLSVLDEIVVMRRQLAAGSNPNRELLLENLVLRLASAGSIA